MGFQASEIINCSPQLVWAVATDWNKAAYWLGIDGLKPVGKRPIGKGTQLAFTARGAQHTTTITHWKLHHALTLESVQGGITATYAYTFEKQDAATKVHLDATCSAEGWFWRLLLPVVVFFMARTDSGQLRALKKLTEAQVAAAERKADQMSSEARDVRPPT